MDTVPLNRSFLTVLGWVNTNGGWTKVMCQNEGPEKTPQSDVNQPRHSETDTKHADEKNDEPKTQKIPDSAEKSSPKAKSSSVPEEKYIDPVAVENENLIPPAPVRRQQTGLPTERKHGRYSTFFPYEIKQDGVIKLKRKCKKCLKDTIFSPEQYRGICGNCNQHLCLMKDCGAAIKEDHKLNAHIQTHRNADLTKCFECGADKIRPTGEWYTKCPNCSIFWCLGNNCGYEYAEENSVSYHFSKAHVKAFTSG